MAMKSYLLVMQFGVAKYTLEVDGHKESSDSPEENMSCS